MLAQHAAIHPRALRIWLLGGLRVNVGEREPAASRAGSVAATLLALLALAPGHALHREQIQDLLWPKLDAPAAANNLHGTLHLLRHLLEPRLNRGSQSSFLVLNSNVLHLRSSGRHVDRRRGVRPRRHCCTAQRFARSDYERALELYAGDLLPRTSTWIDRPSARRLHARFVVLLHELAALYEKTADAAAAIRTLERLVAVEPADEDACAQLMALYARRGQRQQALRQYQLLQRALSATSTPSPVRASSSFAARYCGRTASTTLTLHARSRTADRRERQIIDLLAGRPYQSEHRRAARDEPAYRRDARQSHLAQAGRRLAHQVPVGRARLRTGQKRRRGIQGRMRWICEKPVGLNHFGRR